METIRPDRGGRMLAIQDLGVIGFDEAMAIQDEVHEEVRSGLRPDTLLVLEHPHVFTLGRAASESFIHDRVGPDGNPVPVRRTGRGGQVTYHGPGQVVLYPVLDLRRRGLGVERYVWSLEEVVIRALGGLGLEAQRRAGLRGAWVGERKIASIGIGVSHGVSKHGVAVNVETDLRYFGCLDPCGIPGVEMTSVGRELACRGCMERARALLVDSFARVMGYRPSRHPEWIRVRVAHGPGAGRVQGVIEKLGLRTVCHEAHCPNRAECWSRGEVTFLLLGGLCTRRCGFCAIAHGIGPAPDPQEPLRVARATEELALPHVVLTSVDRDDLPDGGAGHFADTARRIKERCPQTSIEVLVPDFAGKESALGSLLEAPIEVFAHNLETVARLYPRVRPGSHYERSLGVLAAAARSSKVALVKSGLMLGLGEDTSEAIAVMRDLRRVGCGTVTIGQYLRPTPESLPVSRYASPAEFAELRQEGLKMGFLQVQAGPLVRSSYRAGEHLVELTEPCSAPGRGAFRGK